MPPHDEFVGNCCCFLLSCSFSHLWKWEHRKRNTRSWRKCLLLPWGSVVTLSCVVLNGKAFSCCRVLRYITLCPFQTLPPPQLSHDASGCQGACKEWSSDVNCYSSEGSAGPCRVHHVRVPANVLISHWEKIRLTAWRNGALKKQVFEALNSLYKSSTLHFPLTAPNLHMNHQWPLRWHHAVSSCKGPYVCILQLLSFQHINYLTKIFKTFMKLFKNPSKRTWLAPF